MFKYVQVDLNGSVSSIIETYQEFDPSLTHMVRIEDSQFAESFINKRWNGTTWIDKIPEVDARPSLGITTVVSSDPTAIIQPGDITCLAGSTVTATVELRGTDGGIIPLTKKFRMPVISRDGRERISLISLENGSATITLTLPESGVWVIEEKTINNGLPIEEHMKFQRHEIYVTQ